MVILEFKVSCDINDISRITSVLCLVTFLELQVYCDINDISRIKSVLCLVVIVEFIVSFERKCRDVHSKHQDPSSYTYAM